MDYIQDRKLKIRLLKQASKQVATGYLICDALSRAIPVVRHLDVNAVEIYEAVADLKQYIMKAIRPASYYSMWLRLKHPEAYDAAGGGSFALGRLAWINWMIACYEEDIANYKENK